MKLKRIVAAGILSLFLAMLPCALVVNSGEVKELQTIEPEVQNFKTELIKVQEPEVKEIETFEEVSTYVYTTDRVNIRTHADVESEILLTAEVGTKLQRVGKNVIPGWDWIRINDEDYYISNEYVTTEEPEQLATSIEQQLEDSKISASDLRYMSAIIWAEAGNQCEAGQQAVGIVVMNRVASETYKDTVYDVINEPYQFSPVKNGSFSKALSRYDSGEMPECVIDAARYALQGNTTVNYNGKTYDLNGYLCFSRYVSGCRLQIQDHMFK